MRGVVKTYKVRGEAGARRADLRDRKGTTRRNEWRSAPKAPERGSANISMDVLAKELKRHSKLFIILGTVAEVLAAAVALASALPLWVVSTALVGIPLGFFGVSQRRRAEYLAKQVRRLYGFDRMYTRYLTRWVFDEATVPGYWAGTHHSERSFVALKPMCKLTWAITRRSESDLPFSDHPPTCSTSKRSGRVPRNNEPDWLSRLERYEPPVRVCYRMCWRPPEASIPDTAGS